MCVREFVTARRTAGNKNTNVLLIHALNYKKSLGILCSVYIAVRKEARYIHFYSFFYLYLALSIEYIVHAKKEKSALAMDMTHIRCVHSPLIGQSSTHTLIRQPMKAFTLQHPQRGK